MPWCFLPGFLFLGLSVLLWHQCLFLPQIEGNFQLFLFQKDFWLLCLSVFPFETSIMQILFYLDFSHTLSIFSFLEIIFSLCSSSWLLCSPISSITLILSTHSSSILLILSIVFFHFIHCIFSSLLQIFYVEFLSEIINYFTQFCEHLYDCYFELLIRNIAKLCLI